jgi:hypothetical protein
MYGNGADMTGLNQEPATGTYAMDVGTGATTIVDVQLTGVTDGYYVGCTFYNVTRALSGTITAYVGATRTATTTSVAAQANTDTYYIIGRVPTIYLDSKSQVDFDDIRFTKTDGITLLDAWLESYTASSTATIWVELDSLPASPTTALFYVYYGNSTATSNWSGVNTFLFFDDASTGVLTTKWTVVSGTIAYVGGEIKGNAGVNEIKPIMSTYPANTRVRAKVKFDAVVAASNFAGINTRVTTAWTTNSYYAYILGNTTTFGSAYYPGPVTLGTLARTFVIGTWYRLENDVGGSTINAAYDDTYLIQNTNTVNTSGYITLYNNTTDFMYWDDVCVMNYCSPEPLVTAYGAIETATAPLVIQDVKVFQNYLAIGDWLIAIRYIDVYAPYYDTFDVRRYFVFQLVDSLGTVKAQTTVPRWGNSVGNIYLSPTVVTSLTYGGTYYVKLYGLESPNPVVSYLLVASDWIGVDLTRLDSWIISSMSVLSTYYGGTAFTTYIADRGEVLNAQGATVCINGINGCAKIRPAIFETFTATGSGSGTPTQAGKNAINAVTNLGPDAVTFLTRFSNSFMGGLALDWVVLIIFIFLAVFIISIGFAPGHTPAAVLVAFIVMLGGVAFGVNMIYIVVAAIIFAFMLVKQFIMDK